MTLGEFIKIEVRERENYDMSDIKQWQSKYKINRNTEVLWVATEPWIAARYDMMAQDWDNAEDVYNSNKSDYNVEEIDSSRGTIIEESDDGDGGYLMILR